MHAPWPVLVSATSVAANIDTASKRIICYLPIADTIISALLFFIFISIVYTYIIILCVLHLTSILCYCAIAESTFAKEI